MKLTLELPRSIVLGERPRAVVRATNDAATPAEVPNPRLPSRWPQVVTRSATGEALRTHWTPVVGGGANDPARVVLAPGASAEWSFTLQERAAVPHAGAWELEAEVEGVTSGFTPLEVQPVAAEALEVEADASLADGAVWFAWSQSPGEAAPDEEPVQLLVGRVGLTTIGRLDPHVPGARVGAAPRGTRPVLSTAPAGATATERHLAWLDGQRLVVATMTPAGPGPTATLELGRRAALLGPPVAEPEGGATLLVGLEPEGPGAELLVVTVKGAAAAVAHRRVVGTLTPVWGRLFAPMDGPRHALVVVPDRGGALRLLGLPWIRKPTGPDELAPVPARLAELPGRFAGAAACPDGDDGLRGALLAWQARPAGLEERLVLLRWRLRGGALRAEKPAPWGWPERLVGAALRPRVDPRGAVHLLVEEPAGWAVARTLEAPVRLPGGAPRADDPPTGPPALTCVDAGAVALRLRRRTGLEATGVGFALEADPSELVVPDFGPDPVVAGGAR